MLNIVYIVTIFLLLLLLGFSLRRLIKDKTIQWLLWNLIFLLHIIIIIIGYIGLTSDDITWYRIFRVTMLIFNGVINIVIIWYIDTFLEKRRKVLLLAYSVLVIGITIIDINDRLSHLLNIHKIIAYKRMVFGSSIWVGIPEYFGWIQGAIFLLSLMIYIYALMVAYDLEKRNHLLAVKLFAVISLYQIIRISDVFVDMGIVPIYVSIHLLVIPGFLMYGLMKKISDR